MVILDIKDYIDEANRQLNDTNNYEQLDFNPTELPTEKLKSEINNLRTLRILLRKIKVIDRVSDDFYLVSLDFRSLYTNIPHKDRIEAVKQKLRKSKPSISIKVILTF